MKLGIPILVGVLAAGLNFMVLGQKAPTKMFVRVNEDVKAGTNIDAAVLEKVELSGDVGSLDQTAIPYAMRAVLVGRPLPRDLKPGGVRLAPVIV